MPRVRKRAAPECRYVVGPRRPDRIIGVSLPSEDTGRLRSSSTAGCRVEPVHRMAEILFKRHAMNSEIERHPGGDWPEAVELGKPCRGSRGGSGRRR